jgi:hypothetical protein
VRARSFRSRFPFFFPGPPASRRFTFARHEQSPRFFHVHQDLPVKRISTVDNARASAREPFFSSSASSAAAAAAAATTTTRISL